MILETMNDSTEDYSRQLNVPMPPEFVLMNDNTVEEVLLPKVIGKLQAWRGGSYKKPVEGQNALKKVYTKSTILSFNFSVCSILSDHVQYINIYCPYGWVFGFCAICIYQKVQQQWNRLKAPQLGDHLFYPIMLGLFTWTLSILYFPPFIANKSVMNQPVL